MTKLLSELPWTKSLFHRQGASSVDNYSVVTTCLILLGFSGKLYRTDMVLLFANMMQTNIPVTEKP